MGVYVILRAKEEHIIDMVSAYPWGIVTTREKRYLTSWGELPSQAFCGLHCLSSERTRDAPSEVTP